MTEIAPIAELKPHPRNYKKHPDGQLDHIIESIKQNGFFKNVVVAKDGTILAGHGVVEAARKAGYWRVPIRRLDVAPDSPQALKILALDNELGRFAESDDRMLTEMLKEIMNEDSSGLLGTGFDDKMLAAYTMVTRPASEIRDINEANEWVGMPEYDEGSLTYKIIISFDTEADRKRFIDEKDLKITFEKQKTQIISVKWPEAERKDNISVRFEASAAESNEKSAERKGAKKSKAAKIAEQVET